MQNPIKEIPKSHNPRFFRQKNANHAFKKNYSQFLILQPAKNHESLTKLITILVKISGKGNNNTIQ